MARWKILALLGLAVSAGCTVWWLALRPRGPNVLLITLDTTRADRLGCYGYKPARTPFLDKLADEGTRFENAMTHVPLTLPSHATMMTGLLPPEHGLRVNAMGSLPADIPTLAEHFREHGYRTGAFLGAFVLDRRFGLDRGFDKYDDDLSGDDSLSGEDLSGEDAADERVLARRRNAGRVIDSALSWLLPATRQPYFCWIHLYDPHQPYSEHTKEFKKDFEGRGYDAELAFVDQQLLRLDTKLKTAGGMDQTMIVVVGDHGEGLGEHDEPEHGEQLYQTTLRVPFLMHYPQRFGKTQTKVVDTAVGLSDLLPTIADCLDWKNAVPPKAAGRSLRPVLEGRKLTDVPLYCETWEPYFALHSAPQYGVVLSGWKYIRSPKPELYHLLDDSAELKNLASTNKDRSDELGAILKEIRARFTERLSAETRRDAKLIADLKSMSYSAGSSSLPKDDPTTRLGDVKDVMPAFRMTREAMDMSAQNKRPAAIQMLEKIVKEYPHFHPAQSVLAGALLVEAHETTKDPAARTRLLQRAEKLCRDVIDRERDWPPSERSFDAYVTLAGIMSVMDRFKEADEAYDQAAKLQTSNPGLFIDWGRLLMRQQRMDEGLAKLKVAVQIDEGSFTAQSQIGDVLVERAKKLAESTRPEDLKQKEQLESEALRHFELATRYNPQFIPAHYAAGEILMKRKQYDQAIHHFSQIAAVDKNGAQPRYLWALALAFQEKYAEAAKLLREALQLNPQHAEARNLLQLCEK